MAAISREKLPLYLNERHGDRQPSSLQWTVMLISGVLIYGSHSVLLNLCKVDGKIPFNSASVVLMIELTKLLFSLTMRRLELGIRVGSGRLGLPKVKYWVPFSVPALLYCINNNIVVHIQLYMDPASFQVLSNLKIAATAVLYRMVMQRPLNLQTCSLPEALDVVPPCSNRRLSWIQWSALALLTIAGISNSYGGLMNAGTVDEYDTSSKVHVTMWGLVLVLTYCAISGTSGVYTEFILKRQPQLSLHVQNILLYIFGAVLNLFVFLGSSWSSTDGTADFFAGYTVITWVIILTQAGNGLIISAVMKHASNITRLFIISCAMLVTTVASMVLFSLELNLYFCFSFVLVIVAMVLYHRK
ncbi:probable UDP-sugar transporter protein SLC35A4 [Branchiostoma floridae]|uniref:Probable UDP-sugar transporter protein SLC35A4 n=1 Tax=Branchiostoma floridae TaxID=7739 RepID=A0A9J7KFN8_BRAFL|nr:probable UDP-sugar transporter protein SLC35A4 [Branchiostoma floridae]